LTYLAPWAAAGGAASRAAGLLGQHLADGRPAEHERAPEVDGHDRVEIVVLGAEQRLGMAAGQRGVVDQHVQPPGVR